MSVNESERGKGKFDVLIKANGLAVYTIRITKNPKIFLPEYQTALTNDIIHTAKEIFTKAWTANNIRVGDEPRNWLDCVIQLVTRQPCKSCALYFNCTRSRIPSRKAKQRRGDTNSLRAARYTRRGT